MGQPTALWAHFQRAKSISRNPPRLSPRIFLRIFCECGTFSGIFSGTLLGRSRKTSQTGQMKVATKVGQTKNTARLLRGFLLFCNDRRTGVCALRVQWLSGEDR